MSDALRTFEYLHTLMHQFRSHIRAHLETEHPGLTANEARVLVHTARNVGLTQKELIEHSYMDKAQATRLLSNLEDQGWLVRTPCSTDKRARRLHLSPAGDVLVGQLLTLQQSAAEELLAAWPQQDRAQLLRMLEAYPASAASGT